MCTCGRWANSSVLSCPRAWEQTVGAAPTRRTVAVAGVPPGSDPRALGWPRAQQHSGCVRVNPRIPPNAFCSACSRRDKATQRHETHTNGTINAFRARQYPASVRFDALTVWRQGSSALPKLHFTYSATPGASQFRQILVATSCTTHGAFRETSVHRLCSAFADQGFPAGALMNAS